MTRVDPTSPFGHKIRPRQRDRLAIVYVRQSTPQQVASNRESADLQYQLRQRAVTLGWTDERVLVIDDDQGISGSSVENRPGFQRLLAEVSLGHVGIVFGREMSRLARSCKDWHQLLELCGVFQVLLADADGVYDPADFNDRLLLGLKGTMSEAELHILRARLHQGKLNKARRGELFTCVPVGYVRPPEGGIALDPDEQVRSVVSLVFTKFAELGSLTKAHAYFVANNIQFGLRVYKGPGKGRLTWQRPRRSAFYEMLRHPIYAGAYAYGRCPFDPTRRVANKPKSGRHDVPPEEWVCLLKDQVPAYIAWEQYEENRRRLAANDRGGGSKKATGRAPTLLNGIVRCGRCGRPMAARNARASANPRYACDTEFQQYGGPRCQGLVAAYPDRLVESLVLKAVEPASLELSLRTAEHAEQDRERLHRHWSQRLERAGYEADRAQRQHDVVDPENRLVARGVGAAVGAEIDREATLGGRLRPISGRATASPEWSGSGADRLAGGGLAGVVAKCHDNRRGSASHRAAADRASGIDTSWRDTTSRCGDPLAGRVDDAARDPSRPADVPLAGRLGGSPRAYPGATGRGTDGRYDRDGAQSGGVIRPLAGGGSRAISCVNCC